MPSITDVSVGPEKTDIAHVEGRTHQELHGPVGFETDEDHLPPGYYTSTFFIGTLTAISIGFFAGVAGFGLLAPILLTVNADIGPVRHPLEAWLKAISSC